VIEYWRREANDGAKVAQDVGIQASGILFVRVQASVLSRSVVSRFFEGRLHILLKVLFSGGQH
jgi:hypothetical protein